MALNYCTVWKCIVVVVASLWGKGSGKQVVLMPARVSFARHFGAGNVRGVWVVHGMCGMFFFVCAHALSSS